MFSPHLLWHEQKKIRQVKMREDFLPFILIGNKIPQPCFQTTSYIKIGGYLAGIESNVPSIRESMHLGDRAAKRSQQYLNTTPSLSVDLFIEVVQLAKTRGFNVGAGEAKGVTTPGVYSNNLPLKNCDNKQSTFLLRWQVFFWGDVLNS